MKRSSLLNRARIGTRIICARSLCGLGIAGMAISAGCKTVATTEPIVSIPPQSFVRGWSAEVGNQAPLKSLYLLSGQLFAFAADNQAYVFVAASGKFVYSDQIAQVGSPLHAPVMLPDGKVLYPVADALAEYDKAGRRLLTIPLGKTTTSASVAQGYTVYIGLSSETGGRLAALDLQPESSSDSQLAAAKKMGLTIDPAMSHLSTKWEVYTGGAIVGAPTIYQGAIYAGTEDGKVWAVNEGGSGIWELPDGSHTFQADGPIRADLKADDAGVYAASRDGKLYCIDRSSGRIKWTYYAAGPLDDAPILGPSTIYQSVPDYGLVAIDKHAAGIAKPKWFNNEASRFLTEDDKYVYALARAGGLLALDKATGLEVFRSKHKDLTIFVADPKSAVIYGATAGGILYSVKPVLMPGVMGQIASTPQMRFEEVAIGDGIAGVALRADR